MSGNQRVPECLQQNLADACLTSAKNSGNNKNDLAACIQYRALERNQNGVGKTTILCTQTPKNSELVGLVQHQDAASQGGIANNKQVEIKVGQILAGFGFSADQAANLALQTSTFAPGDVNDSTGRGNSCDNTNGGNIFAARNGDFFGRTVKAGDVSDCITEATLSNGRSKAVPAASKDEIIAAIGGNNNGGNNNGGNNNGGNNNAGGNNNVVLPPGQVNFGSCKSPTIEFGAGFDGRKETSFRPVNRDSFNHGSAQGIDIIITFICDRLSDTCKAPAETVDLCRNAAKPLADMLPAKTGGQADMFNAAFGIATKFSLITPLDDQGNPVTK